MAMNNAQALSLLQSHTKSIVNQFVLPNSQDKIFWLKAITEELSFLLLISYVDLIQSKGMDNRTKNQLDTLVDNWAGMITQFFDKDNNVNTRMIVKQKLNKKTQGYSPIIDNILGARLNNDANEEINYKYQLYQLFLDNILDNIEYRYSQKPKDSMEGAMNFINLSHHVESVRQFVFDEKTMIMLSLSSHDTDETTEFDKFITTKNQNKKATRSRATTIKDGVVNFITQCIYHGLQDINNRTNTYINQSNNINLLDGYINPKQYLLSAIIPCFLILAINDSMYLLPPNLSIPIFSMGDKIRDLSSNQEFALLSSYILAVANLLYLQIKRLKDSGKHPALCLISFVPFLGSLFALALAVNGQFPSNNSKTNDISDNDPYIGISYAVSVIALTIFIFTWAGATS